MAGGDPGEVVLTYRELGERLGIEPDSARARARRHGWRVVLDNHGVARVHVPPGELPDEDPSRPSRAGHRESDGADVRGTLAELSAELTRALGDVREERARIVTVQERKIEIRIALARAEGELSALRLLNDELRAELVRARRPWWRRLVG